MWTRRSLFASSLGAAALAAAAPPRAARWQGLLEMAQVPGAAIGRLENGKLAWAEYLGVRDTEQKQPVTAQTVFAAASLTKPLVAWVALQLADARTLDLDRPLNDYLPFAQNDRARRVTARHVLSHSTGFPNWRSQQGPLECSFEPGAEFQYSGEGYYLLQEVLEKINAQPFLKLMRDRALASIPMPLSALDRPEIPTAELAIGHTRRGVARKPFIPGPPQPGREVLPNNRTPNAASSLLATLPDYSLFALRAMSRADWFQPRTKITPHISWGLGWGIEQFRGDTWCWHWGDNPGFKNLILCRPARKDGLVIFTNGDNGQAVYERIVRDVLGDDHPILFWI